MRYVERNPLRARMVDACDAWRWSSLWRRTYGDARSRQLLARWPLPLLARWPLPLPRTWVEHVQQPQTDAEVAAVRQCLQRGAPLGGAAWTKQVAERLGLEFTQRPRGRPRTRP